MRQTVICPIMGSENVGDSLQTLASMRKLETHYQGARGDLITVHRVRIETGIHREHNVIQALAQVLRLFDREQELIEYYRLWGLESDAVLEVQYPQHYAFLSVSIKRFNETWIYGRRGEPRNEKLCRIRQFQMREISEALRGHSRLRFRVELRRVNPQLLNGIRQLQISRRKRNFKLRWQTIITVPKTQ